MLKKWEAPLFPLNQCWENFLVLGSPCRGCVVHKGFAFAFACTCLCVCMSVDEVAVFHDAYLQAQLYRVGRKEACLLLAVADDGKQRKQEQTHIQTDTTAITSQQPNQNAP